MRQLVIGIIILLVVFAASFSFSDRTVVVPLRSGSPGIPSGAVMHFNLDSCPTGWSELALGQGRVLVGISSSGSRGTTQGTPLNDGGSLTITDVPAHHHTVDPSAFTTSSSDGEHTHKYSMSLAGEHSHTWRIENINGFGDYAVAGSENNVGGMTFTPPNAGSHRHSLTINNSTHTHLINVPSTSTSTIGAASVNVTMPYLQLLICEKD